MSKLKEVRKDYWNCIIGSTNTTKLQCGVDSPMRNAVETAYQKITGKESDILLSGWGMTEESDKLLSEILCDLLVSELEFENRPYIIKAYETLIEK